MSTKGRKSTAARGRNRNPAKTREKGLAPSEDLSRPHPAQLQSKVDELERTNNELDNFLTSTNIAAVSLDPLLQIRRFTPAATKLFNLISSDVGRPIRDITQKFTDPDLLPNALTVLDKLMPLRREVRAADGGWYVREVLPYRTRDGRIDGVVITFSDVAAEALRESRLYADKILETLRHPLIVLDDGLRLQSANRAFYEMFQRSPEETAGRLLFEHLGSQGGADAVREILSEVLPKNRAVNDFEVTLDFDRLGRRILLFDAHPLVRDGVRPALILVTIEDITARKAEQHAREETAARLRGIVETAADGIITIDDRGVVLDFNAAAEVIFGYQASEVVGRNVSMLMPSPQREGHQGYLSRYLETGMAKIIGSRRELQGRRKDGSTFPMALVVSEFHDGAGPKFTGIVRDITQQREAEERDRQRQVELAHALRVISLGELSAALAHELNQPLAAIANDVEACATYVRSGETSAAALLEPLQRASNEAVRAGQIVNQVREFLQKGKFEAAPADLSALVRNVLRLVERDLEQKRIDLRVTLATAALPVYVDRIHIEQVILNLLQNGIDAIQEAGAGERQIVMNTARTRDGTSAELTVTDSGRGIPAGATERLFEPFFTTKETGLGMGLAITRSIVLAHEGSISVEPGTGGRGTTVRVILPMMTEDRPRRSDGKGRKRK